MRRSVFGFSLLGGACLLLLPALAQAQEVASAPPSPSDTIVVTGQHYSDGSTTASGGLVVPRPEFGLFGPTSRQDLPLSISSIPQIVLRDQQAQTLFDAVRNDPSVAENLPYSRSGDDDFVIRGFDVNNPTEYRIDDLPLSPQSGVFLQAFERIDIYKGVAGLLYGFSAPGGSVNLISKRPLDGPLTEFRADYASRSQFGGAADVSRRFGPDDQFGARINVAGAAGATEPRGSNHDNYLAAGSFDWRPTTGVRAWTNVSYTRDPVYGTQPGFAIATATVPKAPDNSKLYAPRFEHHVGTVLAIEGGFNADITEWLSARGAAGRFLATRDVRGGVNVITSLSGDYLAIIAPHNHWHNNDTSGEFDVNVHHDFGSLHEQLDLGFTANQDNQHEVTKQGVSRLPVSFNLNGTTNFPDPQAPGQGGGSRYDGEQRYRTFVVRETLGIADWATLTVAGSYASIRQDNTDTPGQVFSQSAWIPSVGLVVKPIASLSVYGSYLRGLQPGAQASELFGAAPVTNANAFTPPARTTQYEVGAKWQVTPGLQADLALFRIEEPGAIYVPNDAAGSSYTFTNDGRQVNKGLEFTLVGQLLPNLTTYSGVTLIDPRITASQNGALDGRVVSGVPRVRFNLSGTYTLPFLPSLSLLGGVYYTGREYIAVDNSKTVPRYATVDIGVKYATTLARHPVALRLYIQNVGGHDYWIGQPNGSISVGDPRTVRIDLSTRL